MTDTPPFVVHPDDLEGHQAHYPAPFDDLELGNGRDLGSAAGAHRLGAWHETLAPGQQTGRLHAHLAEEEALLVLSGNPVLCWRTPGQSTRELPLRPGHYVAFPARSGLAHAVRNPTDASEDAVLLVVGERVPGDRVAFPEAPDFEAWRAEHAPERQWPDAEEPRGLAVPPAYRIETPRVVMRPFEPLDTPRLVAVVRRENPRLKPWFPWAQQVPSVTEQLAWVRDTRAAYDRDENYVLGAFDRSNGLLGGTGLHPRQGPGAIEIGYWVEGHAEGTGLVSEWCKGLTRLALEVLGYERVVIRMDAANARSRSVPQRLGYHLHAVTIEPDEATRTRERDVENWVLTHDALAASPCADAPVRAWDGAGRRLI